MLEYPGIGDFNSVYFPEEIVPAPGSRADLETESNNQAEDVVSEVDIDYLVKDVPDVNPGKNQDEQSRREDDFEEEK